MKNNIFDEIERLKHDYQDLKAEIKELNSIINKSSVSNSRKRGVYTSAGTTCEAVLKHIYQKESSNGKPINKLMLDELITKVTDYLPAQVMINFRTIQAWRNLGTHDKEDMRNVDSNSLIILDMALTNIIEWFFTSYLKIANPNDISIQTDDPKKATKYNENKISISKSKPILKNPISVNRMRTLLADISTELQMDYSELGDKNEISRRIKSSDSQKLASLFEELKKVSKRDNNFQNIQEVQKSVTEPKKTNKINNKTVFNEHYPKNNSPEITCFSEIKIGNQIWMQDNLAVCEFSNGDPIKQAKTKSEWLDAGIKGVPAWCYFKSDARGDKSVGLLYNWYAVSDPRGLAPNGLRLPNKYDYDILISFFGGEVEARDKLLNTKGWQGLRRRKETGTYTGPWTNHGWWCASAGKIKGYCYEFVSNRFCQSSFPKGTGFPVVCIKDTNSEANSTQESEKNTSGHVIGNKSVADQLDDLFNGLNFKK